MIIIIIIIKAKTPRKEGGKYIDSRLCCTLSRTTSTTVDAETDRLIQETIRTEFKGATLLTIAHRIFTLVDYNRIAVLDAGTVVEFDAPLVRYYYYSVNSEREGRGDKA